MKLELKHLAPYLPYKLNIYNKASKRIKFLDPGYLHPEGLSNEKEWQPIINVLAEVNSYPMLRPLSDLTKNIKHNGEKFVPVRKLGLNENNMETSNIGQYYFPNAIGLEDIIWITEKLFEWHFDVFGLIEKGLAIDINTLDK